MLRIFSLLYIVTKTKIAEVKGHLTNINQCLNTTCSFLDCGKIELHLYTESYR